MKEAQAPCPAPFTQLHFWPDGQITPCCYLRDYVLGDIRKQSLDQIWNGDPIVALRREFLSGTPRVCAAKIASLGCNRLPSAIPGRWRTFERDESYPIPSLNVALNGRCNLECVMCDIWKMPNGVYDANGFWEQGARGLFKHLRHLRILGGEPFVQKDIFRLIDEVSRANPRCRWSFTTNAHYRFNDTIRRAVGKIRLHRVAISVDSLIPDVYSEIRAGGSLPVVLKCIDAWIEFRRSLPSRRRFELSCAMTIQKANFMEVPDFIRFCRARGLGFSCGQVLDRPELSVMSLPHGQRAQAADLYIQCVERHGSRQAGLFQTASALVDSLPADGRLQAAHRLLKAIRKAQTRGAMRLRGAAPSAKLRGAAEAA